jgi:hypothetical protein
MVELITEAARWRKAFDGSKVNRERAEACYLKRRTKTHKDN